MGSFGKCSKCPPGARATLLTNGLCRGHFSKIDGAEDRAAAPNKLKGKAENKQTLNVFFKEQEKKIPVKCQNCGEKIIIPAALPLRSAICHILPKRIFKSIQTNPLGVFFGCLDCHKRFDEGGSEKVKKMPILKLCIARVKKLLPLIDPEERRHIPEYFLPNDNK